MVMLNLTNLHSLDATDVVNLPLHGNGFSLPEDGFQKGVLNKLVAFSYFLIEFTMKDGNRSEVPG